jgi:hypothetical protein
MVLYHAAVSGSTAGDNQVLPIAWSDNRPDV